MSETSDVRATITQFTDPMCTWCWGSEPVIRHLRVAYGDQIRTEYVMGGLIEDFDEFYDVTNDVSDPGDVAPHWEEASEMHGMPVDVTIFDVDPAESTYPASRAFVAARQQDRDRANRYIRRLREAYATQVKNINDREVQVELADAVGLDVEEFEKSLDNGTARSEFQGDLSRTRDAGVRAFPTYLVKGPAGERQLSGFQSFDGLMTALSAVAPELEQSSPPSITQFVEEYGPVATQEVAEVYEFGFSEARQTLDALADDGVLRCEPRGNGVFWHAV
jgi:predicted DsbA family dithiol-disulfide isomerase